jgi:hypothetical protein
MNISYQDYGKQQYIETVNKLGKKVMQKINNIVAYGNNAGMNNITQETIVNYYVKAIEQYGEEKALSILDTTVKNTRKKANDKLNEKWNKVKNEIFNKNNCVPTSIKVIKDEIKNGNINIVGIESELWVYEQLSINKQETIQTIFWYEFLYRGFSPMCQPKGHIQLDHNKGKWGVIAYDRPLTDAELCEYELKAI